MVRPAAVARHRRIIVMSSSTWRVRESRRGDEDAQKTLHQTVRRRSRRKHLEARLGRDDRRERDRGRARDHRRPCPRCDDKGVIRSRSDVNAIEFERRCATWRSNIRRSRRSWCRSTGSHVEVHGTRLARAARWRQTADPVRGLRRAATLEHFRITFMGTRKEVDGLRRLPRGRRGAGRDRRATLYHVDRRGGGNRRLHHLIAGAAHASGRSGCVHRQGRPTRRRRVAAGTDPAMCFVRRRGPGPDRQTEAETVNAEASHPEPRHVRRGDEP